ncbi:hypothetical protein VaNZ11_015375 [Volvox africanus]|uniref:RING-type domain-containing protein n=1 Tax=Volvox africanus TaxID=51714 RepID=A0ABQ5SKN2_9CHLO|nr:hypothetical protein VaNZ11_015375 [Volvox africanus]
MSTAEDAVAVEYIVSLPTTEQRRNATSISRSELLSAVRALTGCQRCGFVEQVLAALNPELSSARDAYLPSRQGASGWLWGTSAATTATVGHDTLSNSTFQGTGVFPVPMGRPSLEPQPDATTAPAMGGGTATGCPVVMAPDKVLALLSSSGGSSDLAGLMQFSWKETGSGGAGRDADSGRGFNAGNAGNDGADRLALRDSLLSRPRLLRRFLVDSIGLMQTLAEDVGDCSRHSGYPGPTELASTLARLDLQRRHTLERLAAWGVLKMQSPQAPTAGSSRGSSLLAETDTVPEELGSTGVDVDLDADVDDPALALAIQLSLRESGMLSTASAITPQPSPPPAGSPASAGGHSPGRFVRADGGTQQHHCNSPRHQQQQQQSLTSTPRRMQRITPRQTVITPLSASLPGHSPGASILGSAGGSRPSAATAAGGELAASCEQQQQYSQVQASRLPVAAVLAATEDLTDASVLVDSAAVEALPEGLRERVKHLVSQLVQVQQRRGRLEHAWQHSILAAGRKLLLILLQMLWVSLPRAAASVGRTAEQPSSISEVAEAPEQRGGMSALWQRAGLPLAVGNGVPAQLSLLPDPRQSPSRPQPQSPQPPQPQSQSPQPRRLARYEGLLADLAAGLGEEDTHLVMDLGLNPDLGLGLHLRSEPSALESRDNLAEIGGGRHAEGDTSVILGQNGSASVGSNGSGDDNGDEGWDAALGGRGGIRIHSVVTVPQYRASNLQRSSGLPSPTAATGRQEAIATGQPGLTGRSWYGAQPPAAAMEIALETGRGGLGRGFRYGGLQFQRDACQPECVTAREQQAEQLRALQNQLHRCQSSQSELQGEIGRLLDMLTEQRKMQEQATAVLRGDLAQWQAEPAALQGMGAEELGELAAKLEAALNRVRAAQLQAAAERDLLCPVCWELRKGLVFGCGHQTCCSCGEKLAACPICRKAVSLRIKVYS